MKCWDIYKNQFLKKFLKTLNIVIGSYKEQQIQILVK